MLNETELKQKLEIAEKATPGPWGVLPSNNSNLAHIETQEAHGDIEQGFTICSIPKKRIHDANYIAAFDPSTCAELVREVIRLRAALKEVYEAWQRTGQLALKVIDEE